MIESTSYVKNFNLECYRNNTGLSLWQQHNRASLADMTKYFFYENKVEKPGKTGGHGNHNALLES